MSLSPVLFGGKFSGVIKFLVPKKCNDVETQLREHAISSKNMGSRDRLPVPVSESKVMTWFWSYR